MSRDGVETRPGRRRSANADEGGVDGSDGTVPDDGDAGTGRSDDPPDERTDRRRYYYPMLALSVFFVARAFSEKGLKAFLPTFVVEEYGYTFAVAGITLPPEAFADLYFGAVFLVAAATTPLTGRLVDRHDPRAVLVAFFAVAAVALTVLPTGVLPPLALLAVLLVLGASNWGWVPARDAIIGEFAPAEREGRTFGYLHTVSHLFGAVAPVAIGYVADAAGLRQSFVALVAVMPVALAAVGVLFSSRVYRPRGHGDALDGD